MKCVINKVTKQIVRVRDNVAENMIKKDEYELICKSEWKKGRKQND